MVMMMVMIMCQVATQNSEDTTGKDVPSRSPAKTVSPLTRQAPLTRQQVLTHHDRRHVVVSKTTSLQPDTKSSRPPVRSVSDVRSHCDQRQRDFTIQEDIDSDSSSTDQDDSDTDDDVLWNENSGHSTSQTEAIFVPGRLLGTSDSFCAKSLHDRQSEGQEVSVEPDDEGPLSAGRAADSEHGDSIGDAFADSPSENSARPHGNSAPGGNSTDASDDVMSSPGPAAAFARKMNLRRRQNIRRPVSDYTSQ